jgi:hypothetical protein
MEYTEDDRFIVKHYGAVLTNVPVWCEDAEDACLYRAYSWVEPLIEKVYKLGKKDGYLEGSSDTASAIQSDISYRNGYLG